MASIEFWTSAAGVPIANVRQAERAEADGYDGLLYVDSQNLVGDCYIALALAAHATSTLKLGTGVTNPTTRHAAVTASAIATVQAESGGRAHLGIGRGDSALAHIGLKPASLATFEDYLRRLQAYLRGEAVPFEPGANLDDLHLANQPASSRLEWLRPGQAKVPVDVAATGPRVIRLAALYADRVSFALGADPTRLRWGMDVARDARRAAGLDARIPFDAYITLVVDDDPETAIRIGEGRLSLFARFSAMHGKVVGPVSPEQRSVLEHIHDAYDMTQHSQDGSPQAAQMTRSFAQGFGIFGPPRYCVERLTELIGLGLERIILMGPARGAQGAEVERTQRRLVEEVLPATREKAAALPTNEAP